MDVCTALTSLIEAKAVVVRGWAAVVVLENLGVEVVVLSGVERLSLQGGERRLSSVSVGS